MIIYSKDRERERVKVMKKKEKTMKIFIMLNFLLLAILFKSQFFKAASRFSFLTTTVNFFVTFQSIFLF